jgi:hypothetical protein
MQSELRGVEGTDRDAARSRRRWGARGKSEKKGEADTEQEVRAAAAIGR